MISTVIRETAPRDIAAVLALYPLAFPEEDLSPVVTALLEPGQNVLSLAAFSDGQVLGHVLFTVCGTGDGTRKAALLGPVGVAPRLQRQGLGSSLIRTGLDRLQAADIAQVLVLGDPDYYRRFGFSRESRIRAPYPLPEQWTDAWQSITLGGHTPLPAGRLLVPEAWRRPELWSA